MLSSVAHTLNDIASKYDIAVVAVNHVTTRVETSSTSKIVPALGEQWSHCITNRLMLTWETGHNYDEEKDKLARMATLVKSPARPSKSCFFDITEQGIRVSHFSIVTFNRSIGNFHVFNIQDIVKPSGPQESDSKRPRKNS